MCADSEGNQPCRKYDCPHNLFYNRLRLGTRFKETPLAASWKNCDLNIDRKCKLREIAEMWGMSKERVRQIEERALVHFYLTLKQEVGKDGTAESI